MLLKENIPVVSIITHVRDYIPDDIPESVLDDYISQVMATGKNNNKNKHITTALRATAKSRRSLCRAFGKRKDTNRVVQKLAVGSKR